MVPFAAGDVPELPELHVEETATVWQPFGARWDDGSLRQALCLFRTALPANGEVRLRLVEGAGPERPARTWSTPELDLEIAVWVGAKAHRTSLQPAAVLEENALRRIDVLRARVGPSGLVAEGTLTRWADQEHAGFELGLFFSDPGAADLQIGIARAEVISNGRAWLVRHSGPLAVQTELTEQGSRTVLLERTVIGDGQGVRRAGVLVPPLRGDGGASDQTLLAAATAPPLAATSWRGRRAYGPFGVLPETPSWLRGPGLRAALARRHAGFAQRSRGQSQDPFAAPVLGLAKTPGQSGDQNDFGVVKVDPVAGTGIPSFLLEVEASVLQEACRPVHFFEADGAPVQAAAHPDWVVWSGRTHWNCEVSRDRLGKPCPEPGFETHGWFGKDRQHWSSLYLCGYYLLTGAPWARLEIDNEVQLYLAGQTLDPELTTSGPGAPRAAGRVLLTACWLYQCTGNEELLARMDARVEQVYHPCWAGRELGADRVRPYEIMAPDPRILHGEWRYWSPWQDSLAAVGFAAFHRLTGNETARELAGALASNAVRHGWRTDEGRTPVVAHAVRWQEEGVPLTSAQLAEADATMVQWADDTDFASWSIGAVEIAMRAAQRRHDAELRTRAEAILAALRGNRGRPPDGWFDRFGQWDAVR